jgi:hypothetical protein
VQVQAAQRRVDAVKKSTAGGFVDGHTLNSGCIRMPAGAASLDDEGSQSSTASRSFVQELLKRVGELNAWTLHTSSSTRFKSSHTKLHVAVLH